MTLYELLKPNVLSSLEKASLITPTTVELITEALQRNYYVRDLPYGIVFDLQCILDYSFDVSPHEMFMEKEMFKELKKII